MKRIEFSSFGGPDVLQIVERDDLKPASGNVTIAVSYVGIGLIDALLRAGLMPLPMPFCPGLEVSGHIAEIGEGVGGFHVGQPVAALLLLNFAGYATQVEVPAVSVVPVEGKGVDLISAAATIVNFATAYVLMHDIAPVGAQSAVMVHGASGGLGTACVKMARALGATNIVATTSSPAKADYLRDLGARPIVFDKDGELDLGEQRFDVIVDPVGGPLRQRSLPLLGHQGKLLLVGGADEEADVALSSTSIWLNCVSVIGVNIGAISTADPPRVAAAAKEVFAMLNDGRLTAGPIDVLPFGNVAEAHRKLESKSVTGKLLLAVD